MEQKTYPYKIGTLDFYQSKDTAIYQNTPDGIEGISFAPNEKNPNEGLVWINHETGKWTYQDGTSFIPFHTNYHASIVLTHCDNIAEFGEKYYDRVNERIKERLEKCNK